VDDSLVEDQELNDVLELDELLELELLEELLLDSELRLELELELLEAELVRLLELDDSSAIEMIERRSPVRGPGN
jgi:hypothetical protein